MAITYLSGQRIQGSSTADNPVDEWGIVGTSFTPNATEERFDFQDPAVNGYASTETASYDIGEVQGNEWTLRMKVRYTTLTSGDSEIDIVLSDTNQTAGGNDNQDFIGVRILPTGGGGSGGIIRPNQGAGSDPRTGQDSNNTVAQAIDTDYYLQIQRTSITDYSVKWGTATDYSGNVANYTNGSGTDDLDASITGLRYIKICNGETESYTNLIGHITELKFWDSDDPDETPTKSFTFAYTDDKTTVTDVPDGSQFEETDTRKFYQFAENTPNGLGSDLDFDTTGLAELSTTQKVLGSKSLFIDHSGNANSSPDAYAQSDNEIDLSLIGDGAYTVVVWVYMDTVGSAGQGRQFYDVRSSEYGFQSNSSGAGGSLSALTGSNGQGQSSTSTGTWYFYASHRSDNGADNAGVTYGTYDSGGGNSLSDGSSATNSNDYTHDNFITLGSSTQGDQSTFDGYIDEFSLWNRELTNDEIISLFNGGAGARADSLVDLSNLLVYYDMEDKTNKAKPKGWTERGTAI